MSRTNSEATSGHSAVPKLQLWNIPELRKSLTSRSAEVISPRQTSCVAWKPKMPDDVVLNDVI